METFAYGRVGTKDQTTENQRQEIQRAGYQVDYWFADEGVSGKMPASQRPQFRALLDKIRDGETLVVSKLDRLGRDAQDVGATIKALAAQDRGHCASTRETGSHFYHRQDDADHVGDSSRNGARLTGGTHAVRARSRQGPGKDARPPGQNDGRAA